MLQLARRRMALGDHGPEVLVGEEPAVDVAECDRVPVWVEDQVVGAGEER